MKRTASAMAWVLVAAGLTYVGAAAVTQGGDRTKAAAFHGYAAGTAVHVDALQTAPTGPRVADTDIAHAGATVKSDGFGAPLLDELGETIQPAANEIAGKDAAGLGTPLQLGLGTSVPNNPNADQLILSAVAHATAPPDKPFKFSDCPNGPTCTDVGPIPADPVVYAQLLHGEASAQFESLLDRCPAIPLATRNGVPYSLNNPFSRGKGHVVGAELVDTGTANPTTGAFNPPLLATDTPGQNVVDTETWTYPYNNGDGTFGLVTEVHQLLAPVRIANSLVVEIGGEWVLRAIATGHPAGYRGANTGGARIEYAPAGSTTPTTPVVRILQVGPGGALVEQAAITLQALLGAGGLQIPADPLLHVNLGGPPRAIGGADLSPPTKTTDGTTASAAVDVLSLQLLNAMPGFHVADVRVGHMQVLANVPVGGFSVNDCGQLRISKAVIGNLAGPFTFHVDCPGAGLNPDESDFTLVNGDSKVIPVPTGTQCAVTEPGNGGATSTTISESGPPGSTGASTSDGVVTIPDSAQTVNVDVLNQNVGNLRVSKLAQDGLNGPFGFTANCVYNGQQLPNGTGSGQVPRSFTLNPNDSKTFTNLPGGTTCSIREVDPGGAAVTRITDSTAPTDDGNVVIRGGGQLETVNFSNAGPPLVITKLATGDAAGKGPFAFHLVCTDPNGAAVALDPADTDFTLASGDQHVITRDLPDGSVCKATETDNAGATSTAITDTEGATDDGNVTVRHLFTQVVAFSNNFAPQIKLLVAKKVIGTGSTGPFAFHVVCVNPDLSAITLAAGDANFTLNDGQSHGIKSLPTGAKCQVTETDAKGAAISYADSTAPANDGAVAIPADGAATTTVTNTYVPPPPNPPPPPPPIISPHTVG